MRYRYLQERGALNETGTGPAQAPVVPGGNSTKSWGRGRISPELIAVVPESVARENQVVPVASEGETVLLVAVDYQNIALADKLSFLIARKVRLVPATRDEIVALLKRYYPHRGKARESVDSMLQEFNDSEIDFSEETVRASSRAAHAPPTLKRDFKGLSTWSQAASAQSQHVIPPAGLDPTCPLGVSGVFTYVVEDGQRVLMRRPNGTIEVVIGPKQVWRGKNVFRPMQHFVAHPGDYLIVRQRNGLQEHLSGPAEIWFDPRIHQEVTREEALQVAAKEAVVVYSGKEGTSNVQRRIEYGPALFMPRPGEWLHTFAWHSSEGGAQGAPKVSRGLVFQKLWLMPDQMYHDVPDVRTADDAVLTIRLMIFFELLDIATMLETTHDPIGDFVNAATSDVVDFTGRHDFESFKRNTDKLNELETYRQLAGRAAQCGYRINKVVYRGYGAPERLQQMHDQAIEARTRLQLDRATEQQAQDLENFRLDSQLLRADKRRQEQSGEVAHDLELAHTKQESKLRDREARQAFERQQKQLEADLRQRIQSQRDVQQREQLAALSSLGVDLTAYLTQARADRVIELRGPQGTTHVHLDPARAEDGSASPRR